MGSVSSSMSVRTPTYPPAAVPTHRSPPVGPSASLLNNGGNNQPAAGPSNLASLRAAALKSAPSRRSGSSNPSSIGSQPGRVEMVMSAQSGVGVPLSRVDIAEREEGEISDEEDREPAPSVRSSRSRPSVSVYRQDSSSQWDVHTRVDDPYGRGGVSQNRQGLPSSFGISTATAGPSNHASRNDLVRTPHSLQPAITSSSMARSSSVETVCKAIDDGSLAAPSDISPEDAQKYMDIIRKLLQGGYSPDLLVKRGATAKYVTAVCEEIVQGTKRRKALWLGPSSSPTSTAPSTVADNQKEPALGGSPSSEVEILVSTERRGSMSSEGSAEFELIEKPSPPPARPPRLLASSHWAPPSQPAPPASSAPPLQPPVRPAQSATTRPIRIESYKPAQPTKAAVAAANANPGPGAPKMMPSSVTVAPASHLSAVPWSNPAGPPSLSSAVVAPSPVPPTSSSLPQLPSALGRTPPTEPKRHKQKKGKKGKKSKDDIDTSGPPVLNYDDEEPMLLDPPLSSALAPKIPIPPTAQLPPRPSSTLATLKPSGPSTFPTWFSSQIDPSALPLRPNASASVISSRPPAPILDAGSQARAEVDARNAILEAKRKVLESMKSRQKTSTAVSLPDIMPKASVETPSSATPTAEHASSVAIAEGKTIEEEMHDLEQEVLSLQKEAETEAMDIDEPEEGEITPASLSTPLAPVSALPLDPPSLPNVKRGIKRPNVEDLDARPTTAQNRPRRKPFGGPPIKPSRLMINLDDHSDSDSDDETRKSTPVIGLDAVMREKELQIRLLKEKIAARMREKTAKKAQAEASAEASECVAGAQAQESLPVPVPTQESEGANSLCQVLTTASNFTIVKGDVKKTNPKLSQEPPMLTRSTMLSPLEVPIQPLGDQDQIVTNAQRRDPVFAEYRSLMGRYPQLTATTHAVESFPQFKLKQPIIKPLANVFKQLDRHLLCSIILTNRLAENPHAMICPAEAGGGTCANATCDALHLDKGDPQEKDWVEYLVQSIAADGDGNERARVETAVRRATKTKAKGKGKAPESGRAEVITNTLASESALTMFLGKIGEAYLSQAWS